MDPEELKRLQDAEVKLTKSVTSLGNEKERLSKQLNKTVKDLNATKANLTTSQQDSKNFKVRPSLTLIF